MAGAMFFMSMCTFMPAFMMTNLAFSPERPVFLREQANKMYGVLPYFVAKILSDLPSFIWPPTIFALITFFGVGFTNEEGNFFIFWANIIMSTLAGTSMGYLISTSISDGTIALQMAPVLVMPLMLVGGFFRNQDDMPTWMQIFAYIAPFKYVFNIFARSEFEKSPYENTQKFLDFLDIESSIQECFLYLGIIIACCLIMSGTMLKLTVSRF